MKSHTNNPYDWLILSLVITGFFVFAWAVASVSTDLPSPIEVADTAWYFLSDPFYDFGPNDQGIAILTLYTLMRLLTGFVAGTSVAIVLGVLLGLSPVFFKALNPHIQILRSISPIAWMPLLLYSVQDSHVTALLVVFMASVWPTLANTAFGVSKIKKEYLDVANILQMHPVMKILKVVLPAAGPTIVAGLKISMGAAWVAIVPAEALLGSLGLGYFVWNEWNNLSLPSVVFAILVIGFVGVFIDLFFTRMARRLSYVE
ncbi:MAG: ABC transporter permease [Desulfovibrionales bacterium]